jgi:hypothetical protein
MMAGPRTMIDVVAHHLRNVEVHHVDCGPRRLRVAGGPTAHWSIVRWRTWSHVHSGRDRYGVAIER